MFGISENSNDVGMEALGLKILKMSIQWFDVCMRDLTY